VCLQISPFYKDTSHNWIRDPPLSSLTSSKQITSSMASFPNKSHSEMQGFRTSTYYFWEGEDIVQPITVMEPHIFGDQKSKIKVLAGLRSLQRLQERILSCLFQLLVAPGCLGLRPQHSRLCLIFTQRTAMCLFVSFSASYKDFHWIQGPP